MTLESAELRKQIDRSRRNVGRLWQHRALPAILLLAPTLLLSGCAGLVSAGGTKSQAAIQVTPSSFNFGNLVVGKKVSQTATVLNTGNTSINVTAASVSSGQFAVSGITVPLSLPVGQSSTFQVWFDPSAAGTVTGTLTIQTDTGVSSGQVALTGVATTPPQQISVSSTTLNLGSATVGTTLHGSLTLTNTGGANLIISLISVSGGPFGVSGITTPSSIVPGGSATMNVSFTPTTAGNDSGSVSVTSNDPNSPTTTVTLTGTATSSTVAPTITTQPVSQTVASGQTATFGVVAGGTAPLSYQWQKNGVNIGGATLASYTTQVTATTDSGSTFDVKVSNTAGSVTSNAATLTVNAAVVAPAIATQPVGQTVTAGQTATFSVIAGGTAPLSYQWQKNGVNIGGATLASYTTPATATTDSGSTFDVVVSNTAGSTTSTGATLTVTAAVVAPTITAQPVNQTVTAGQTATFSVVAGGTAPLTYRWRKNGVNIAGAKLAIYTTPATAATDSGATFDVVVSNTAGSVTTSAATLTVNAAVVAPTITAQPVNQSVTAGHTATFSVVAGGAAPLSYQWRKNGANITGATASSYTTPATAATDSGSTFDVVVSNTAGSVTSTKATLTVTAAAVAPTITAQPVNQTVTAGQTVTFSVVAGGTAPLSYQWQKNGANIAGATASSYTTPATATADSGSTFVVVVSNTAGSVTSNAATLTVNAAVVAPTITTQPVSQTVTAGQTATFGVVAGGTAPLSYQWQKNGVNIAGATLASYTTPVTATSDSGSTFDVVVSNAAGSVTSSAATLTVNAAVVAPTITTQPVSQTVTAGQTATFGVVAGGTAPLSYQWQKNGVNIAGATLASYTTPATATTDGGSTFDVKVSNTAGSVTSNAAMLTVTAAAVAPTITAQPVNQTVTAGQTATFSVVAGGTAPLSYQWQKNGVNIAGATLASYTTPATATTDSGSTFGVVVSNTAGSVTSSAATLTVNAAAVAPTVTTQPVSQTVTAGQTATFSVVAGGTAPLSYQWQKNGVNIAGATLASYTTPTTATTDSGSTFDVVVSNTAGSVTSAKATLTVNPALVAGIQLSSNFINFGNGVVGSNSSQSLIITNTGTATLTITQMNETGSAFNVSGFTLPINVNVGQQATITVAFLPTAVGPLTGTISIVSDAPTSPTSVTLNGTGIAATHALSINPTSLSFGNITTATSAAPQTVTISNTGNSSVTISQINLSGTGYTMAGGSAPVTLSPTQNLILTVVFSPTAVGSVNGSISIVSNATVSPAPITLTGTGVAPVQHSVALSWTASTSTVTGYNVYRGTTSGGPYTKINSSLITTLAYTDTTVQSGTTYFYVATSVDSSGGESVNSNEVSASIP
jgi:hypothetical protein